MEAAAQDLDGSETNRPASQESRRSGPAASNADNERDALGRPLSDMDRQYATQNPTMRRIHIVGTGSIGKLVAHALRGLPDPPPVSLIFHRGRLLEAWTQTKETITIEDNGIPVTRGGFVAELMPFVLHEHGLEESVYEAAGERLQPHAVAAEMKALSEQELAEGRGPSRSTPTPSEVRRANASWNKYIINHDIHHLIIATKATHTAAALRALKHRLSAHSTICFLQNGMGVIDEINEKVFPDPATRPNYMQGVVTHGVNVPPQKAAHDPFFAIHAGHGTISLGLLPRDAPGEADLRISEEEVRTEGNQTVRDGAWSPSARYLLRTLSRSPALGAVGFTPTELLQLQLEKLAVNSVLNVLTALLDHRNGAVLYNFSLTRTMRLMLAETSLVIRSLPELQHVPNQQLRFGPDRLEQLVVHVANTTRDNISSTLADVRAGRKTELEYINGYIVRRGEELGIKCVVNYAMMHAVMAKALMIQRDARDDLPVDKSTYTPN